VKVKASGDRSSMKFYTIRYGGRVPDEFASLLVLHDIRSFADVRIRPSLRSAPPDLEGDHLPDPAGVLFLAGDDDLKWSTLGREGLAVAMVSQKYDAIGES
jgi:hypothetical protein